jgi:hypothetical protein
MEEGREEEPRHLRFSRLGGADEAAGQLPDSNCFVPELNRFRHRFLIIDTHQNKPQLNCQFSAFNFLSA